MILEARGRDATTAFGIQLKMPTRLLRIDNFAPRLEPGDSWAEDAGKRQFRLLLLLSEEACKLRDYFNTGPAK